MKGDGVGDNVPVTNNLLDFKYSQIKFKLERAKKTANNFSENIQ